MDFIQGETLEEYLALRGGTLSLEEVLTKYAMGCDSICW